MTTTTTVEPTEPRQIAPESSIVTTPNNPSRNNRKAPLEQANSNPTDTNPLWKGYSWLAFTSVVCCASASNLKYYEGSTALCITFASVSFGISVIILLLDRFQGCFESFKFHKAYDGKLEGFSLLFLAIWWIIGVAILTSSGGAAYSALNIYFSSWLSLLATCYTLNCWSGSQDILTLQELTALSPTLRGWYCLLFSSLVVMGSGVGMHLHLDEDGPKAQASFAISAGLISMIVAAILILSYYRILSFIAVGGFIELGITCILFLLWIVSVGILTQDGSVAASISGQCGNKVSKEIIPGSNLYAFSWMSLCSVMDIVMCWKSMQAMAFAQTGSEQNADRLKKNKEGMGEELNDDDDDDEDDEL